MITAALIADSTEKPREFWMSYNRKVCCPSKPSTLNVLFQKLGVSSMLGVRTSRTPVRYVQYGTY